MHAQKAIEQLGYTSKEAKVYLAALTLGEAHISDIAAKVKLPRSSVQLIADKLHKDGLMNFYVMRRYKYWVAENPERLLSNIHRHEEAIHDALPSLTAIRTASYGKRRKKVDIAADWEPFRILADNTPQAILIADANANIVYVNSHWEKQFGFSLEEVEGQNPSMLDSGKTPITVYERMWKDLRKEKMFQSDEIIDKRRDGTFFNLLTTIIPVRHNNHLFYIQILDDITERKRVEELRSKFMKSKI